MVAPTKAGKSPNVESAGNKMQGNQGVDGKLQKKTQQTLGTGTKNKKEWPATGYEVKKQEASKGQGDATPEQLKIPPPDGAGGRARLEAGRPQQKPRAADEVALRHYLGDTKIDTPSHARTGNYVEPAQQWIAAGVQSLKVGDTYRYQVVKEQKIGILTDRAEMATLDVRLVAQDHAAGERWAKSVTVEIDGKRYQLARDPQGDNQLTGPYFRGEVGDTRVELNGVGKMEVTARSGGPGESTTMRGLPIERVSTKKADEDHRVRPPAENEHAEGGSPTPPDLWKRMPFFYYSNAYDRRLPTMEQWIEGFLKEKEPKLYAELMRELKENNLTLSDLKEFCKAADTNQAGTISGVEIEATLNASGAGPWNARNQDIYRILSEYVFKPAVKDPRFRERPVVTAGMQVNIFQGKVLNLAALQSDGVQILGRANRGQMGGRPTHDKVLLPVRLLQPKVVELLFGKSEPPETLLLHVPVGRNLVITDLGILNHEYN